MPDVVVAEFIDEAALASLAGYDVLYDRDLYRKPLELHRAVYGARGLIVRNQTQVRGPLIDSAPALKVIGRLGVGLDNIDTQACRNRGIAVCPATGANDAAVAEYVIAAALILLRPAYGAAPLMTAGRWPRQALMGGEIGGKTLGLVGYGATARATAVRARALGMAIIACDPQIPAADLAWSDARKVDLHTLMAESDVISLHMPLTPATRRMIGAPDLARCKPGAILVNAARGGVIDEEALVGALRAGKLGGAALDVFESEPMTAQSGQRFTDVPNLILTPHIAGLTRESNARVSAVTVASVRRVLEGR
ncbi:MAG: hydroxyacid dehydrogenase [Alphaproteobacteria bacterium]|nr:hydroxyacid dehydrogenase [Alphaproteobacteria bacterium]